MYIKSIKKNLKGGTPSREPWAKNMGPRWGSHKGAPNRAPQKGIPKVILKRSKCDPKVTQGGSEVLPRQNP